MIINSFFPGKILIFCFILFSVISFVYSLCLSEYNGDFMGVSVDLPFQILIFNLIISSIPFIFLYFVYKYFKKKGCCRYAVKIQEKEYFFILLFIILWSIIMTLLFDVGVMGKEMYSAPTVLSPFIQFFNRLNPSIIGLIYIYASENKKRITIIIILLLVLGLLRAGLGSFMFIVFTLLLKNSSSIFTLLRRKMYIILIVLIVFPMTVESLYNFRSSLRGDDSSLEMGPMSLFSGKLVGRLSSFSNSAMILQNIPFFYMTSQSLEKYYFQKLVLTGFFGTRFSPEVRPEVELVRSVAPESENVSYMTGTQGNLIFSAFKSPLIFLLNIITIIVLVFLNFLAASLLRFSYCYEYCILNMSYCLMSGVANEFSFYLFTNLLLFFFILLIHSLKKHISN